MKRDRRRFRIRHWRREPDGTIVEGVKPSSRAGVVTTTFAELAARAELVEAMFEQRLRPLPHNSGLGKVVNAAKAMAPVRARVARPDQPTKERAMMFDAISHAILALGDEPDAPRHLTRLLSGDVDHLDRSPSSAKDALWEYEVLRILRAAGLPARLDEAPDVVAELNEQTLGVACKVIYTDEGTENAVRKAVRQIDRCGRHGIVAINISELIPAQHIAHTPNGPELTRLLSRTAQAFLGEHLAGMVGYFNDERILGALIGIQIPVQIDFDLKVATEHYFYVNTGPDPVRQRIADDLGRALSGIDAGRAI